MADNNNQDRKSPSGKGQISKTSEDAEKEVETILCY